MCAAAASGEVRSTFNAIVSQGGEIQTRFTDGPIASNITNLLDAVIEPQRDLFQAALKMKQVWSGRFTFLLQGGGDQTELPLTVTFQPSLVHRTVHVIAREEAAAPDAAELHRLKGLVALYQGLLLQDASSGDAATIEELQKDITQRGSSLTPSDSSTPYPSRSSTTTIRLNPWIQKIEESYLARAKAEGKTLVIRRSETLPSLLYGDLESFDLICDNLLSNGIKYCAPKEGRVEVSISSSRTAANRIELTFSVKDNGEGIPEEKREVLFQKGNRLGKESSDIEGEGIGLWDSKQKAEELGWSLDFQKNSDGPGTTFILKALFSPSIQPARFTPLSPVPGSKPPSPSAILHLPQPQKVVLQKERKAKADLNVFFVEDDPLQARIGMGFLKSAGIPHLRNAKSFEDAKQGVENLQLDILITDAQLWGGETGQHLIQARRNFERSSKTKPIPCILCSADALEPADWAPCGANETLVKPYSKKSWEEMLKLYFEEPQKAAAGPAAT